jgi:TfoX/Sxy family transcriptional regulator of competence genes
VSRTPEELFQGLVEAQLGRPGTSVGRMFGSPILKVAGKVFAMLVKGRLVVKLPKQRVEELLASGVGELFDPGHGKPSKEWAAVDASVSRRWRSLVDEARAFVASHTGNRFLGGQSAPVFPWSRAPAFFQVDWLVT